MANSKKKARTTKEHYLPADYAGRCTGTENVDYVNGFPTFGRISELPKENVLHKFEMRLPIPTVSDSEFDSQCQELFNLKGSEIIDKALEKLKTDLDELFKSFLFSNVVRDEDGELYTVLSLDDVPEGDDLIYSAIESPVDVEDNIDPARHILAQEQVDVWRYTPRQAGKSVTVSAFIQQLINSGRVDAEALEGIETQAELFAKLAELGIL